MKKILIILSIIVMTGCSMLDINNTPTKKVEEYLNKFQINDEDVLKDLDKVINENINLDEENKKEYRELIKKQYKDMQYKIKETKQDGDKSSVTVEIIVKDFTKVISERENYKNEHIEEYTENGAYNDNLYKKDLIDNLKKTKDKITYTLEFNLHKENKKWVLDPITEEIEDKILGIYKY